MALSDDLYDHATRVRHAEHPASIVGWRGSLRVARAHREDPRGPTQRARARRPAGSRRIATVARRRDLVDRPGAGHPADRRSVDRGRRSAHVRPRRRQTFVMPAARRNSATFGVVFVVTEILCFIGPPTPGRYGRHLGFLFTVVGVSWMVEAVPGTRAQPAVMDRIGRRRPHRAALACLDGGRLHDRAASCSSAPTLGADAGHQPDHPAFAIRRTKASRSAMQRP